MRAFFCFAGAFADVVFFQPQTAAYPTSMTQYAALPSGYVPASQATAFVVEGPAVEDAGSAPSPVAAAMLGLVAGAAFSMRHKVRSLLSVDGVETSSTGEGLDFKMSFTKDGKAISPWHDIPAYAADDKVNFICEIPKYGLAKMECSTKGENNPIVQDEKKGKARFYHGKIFWNYGFVPQTWENPDEKDEATGFFGDGDPLDVVEIGSADLEMGSITAVKPLGALAMIDDGELDWKLLAINPADPLAAQLNDISDVEKLPGVVSGIREWFRWYKTPDDKPLNEFGYDEKALPKAKSMEIIADLHKEWQNLYDGKTPQGKMWTGK
jgi:inorganic pyrophosphatase